MQTQTESQATEPKVEQMVKPNEERTLMDNDANQYRTNEDLLNEATDETNLDQPSKRNGIKNNKKRA